jgi:dephospho-CoA kinase
VDRAALGKIVFADPKALADLDALVHPLARSRIWTAVELALVRDEKVVLEMALLYRWPQMVARLDSILGIHSCDAIRLERLVARSGLTREAAMARLGAQDQEVILALARTILDNDGSQGDLEAQLAKI